MKTIILCGGLGTRMKEETEFKPKPLVLVGGKPVLWHIMKLYAHYGFHDFIIALGYKGEMIKEYFLDARYFWKDFTLDVSSGQVQFHDEEKEKFSITFAETGLHTLTGGRILRVQKYLDQGPFMVTFGDGVGDIDLSALLSFHQQKKKLATITGVHPSSKYGLVQVEKNLVKSFQQKPRLYDYVSGGFMVFEREALSLFDDGDLENMLLTLLKKKELALYPHEGFWKAVDTIRELEELNALWEETRPWAIWEKPLSGSDETIKTVLVTGNLGYIGSVMTPLLMKEGYRVIGLDWGLLENIPSFMSSPPSVHQQIKKDIRDITLADLHGVDAIIHLAALSDAPQEALGKTLMMKINAEATIRLATLAKKAGVKRFLFASSCSVYGKADGDAPVTEDSPLNPLSTYALSKVKAEQGLRKLADHSFCPAFLRSATCYGISPRMRFDLVVNNLLAHAIVEGEIKILSDGKPWRPIVHIEDVGRAYLAVLRSPREKVFQQVLNIGRSEENYQIQEIAALIKKKTPGTTVRCLNTTGPDKRSYRVNFEKLKRLGNFSPQWTVSDYLSVAIPTIQHRGLQKEEFYHQFQHLPVYQALIRRRTITKNLQSIT